MTNESQKYPDDKRKDNYDEHIWGEAPMTNTEVDEDKGELFFEEDEE